MLCISAAQQDQAGAGSCQCPHSELFETASADKAMLQYVVNVLHCGCD